MVKISENNNAKVNVPTAFTPDGNNVNDRLRPLGKIGKIDYFRVYNRWGNMVFQTNKIGDGWDGNYKGVGQQSETYTWIFSGQMTDGQSIKISGKTKKIIIPKMEAMFTTLPPPDASIAGIWYRNP